MNASELREHLDEVNRRWAAFDDEGTRTRVMALATPILARWWKDYLSRALSAPSRTARVLWLRKEADSRTGSVKAISACVKQKCSHCCNQSVTISEDEARVIGEQIGVKVREPDPSRVVAMPKSADEIATMQRGVETLRTLYTGVPCVFLKAGRCSIYEARPIACRLLVSLASDDFLCRIIPGESVRVPYLDTTPETSTYAMASLDSRLSDLRDWFPRGLKGAK